MKIQETFSIQQTTMKKRKLIVSHLKITKTQQIVMETVIK